MSSILDHARHVGDTNRRLLWDWRDLFSLRPTWRREEFFITHPLPDGNIFYHFRETCLAFGPLQWVKVVYTGSTHD